MPSEMGAFYYCGLENIFYNYSMQKIDINSTEVIIQQATLKRWLLLSDILSKYGQAKRSQDLKYMSKCIYDYLALAIADVEIEWKSLPWTDVVTAFSLATKENQLGIDFPIMISKTESVEGSKPDLEYPGRTWYMWANMFAMAYHWSLSEIELLPILEAIPLLQEIMLENQHQKEWEWKLSEIAYPYNSSTKRHVFTPLEKPSWMRPHVQAPKKIKIRKDFIPVGNVIDLGQMEKHIQ